MYHQKKVIFLYNIFLLIILSSSTYATAKLPKGFVYLKDIDPSIQQDIRYAGSYNFMGRPIVGYQKPVCILKMKTAYALKKAQAKLSTEGYGLKVYDCYRPRIAANDMFEWSHKNDDQTMKSAFFPREEKMNLFKKEYIARYSSHTLGNTVDLTLVNLQYPVTTESFFKSSLQPCYSAERIQDNDVDMGTNFDCLDNHAEIDNKSISFVAQHNRALLRSTMEKVGFIPYKKEWWHFTFKSAIDRRTYNFSII